MYDIPPGWSALIVGIVVALIGLAGTLIIQRYGRMARLEAENRRLWYGLRLAVDAMYRGGVPVPPALLNLIDPDNEE